jgi:hypothetical protein
MPLIKRPGQKSAGDYLREVRERDEAFKIVRDTVDRALAQIRADDLATEEGAERKVREVMGESEPDKVLDDDTVKMTAGLLHALWKQGHFRK